MKIGSKIKQLRTLCQLTQSELADRCELTKGYISQLENDLTSPSISTLTDILGALGSNLKEFFNDDSSEKIVFKKDDYFEKENIGHKITWLVPNSQKNMMEPILLEIEPFGETTKDMPHEGQEFGYVIEGKVQIIVGSRRQVVKKGETFYFETDKDHFIKNNTDKVAKIIWVSTPPNF